VPLLVLLSSCTALSQFRNDAVRNAHRPLRETMVDIGMKSNILKQLAIILVKS